MYMETNAITYRNRQDAEQSHMKVIEAYENGVATRGDVAASWDAAKAIYDAELAIEIEESNKRRDAGGHIWNPIVGDGGSTLLP